MTDEAANQPEETPQQPKGTHWKKLMNPKYLGSYDLEFGKEYHVKIERIEKAVDIIGDKGKKEKKPILHFVGASKPLILNPTNAKMMTVVSGTPEIEGWIGKTFVIKVVKEKTNFDPQPIDVIRVMNKKA